MDRQIEDAVIAYAIAQPEYGGRFRRDSQLVVLFTDKLDKHQKALDTLVGQSFEELRVAKGSRLWTEVTEANQDLQRRLLLGPDPVRGVTGVGIGVNDGQFVASIHIDNDDPAFVAAIQHACLPHPVHVRTNIRWERA